MTTTSKKEEHGNMLGQKEKSISTSKTIQRKETNQNVSGEKKKIKKISRLDQTIQIASMHRHHD